jgi:hypothetical protein
MFQEEINDVLTNLFDPTAEEKHQIEQISENAARLRTDLNEQDGESPKFTVNLIEAKLEERVEGGPAWAWNQWYGTLESLDVFPGGYEV